MTEWELQNERQDRQKEKEKKKRGKERERRDEKKKSCRTGKNYLTQWDRQRRGGGRFMTEGIFGVFTPLSSTVGFQKGLEFRGPLTHTRSHTLTQAD